MQKNTLLKVLFDNEGGKMRTYYGDRAQDRLEYIKDIIANYEKEELAKNEALNNANQPSESKGFFANFFGR